MNHHFRFAFVSLTIILVVGSNPSIAQQGTFPPPSGSQENTFEAVPRASSPVDSIRINELRSSPTYSDPEQNDSTSMNFQDEPRGQQAPRPWDALPVRPPGTTPGTTEDLGGFQSAQQATMTPRQLIPAENTETRVADQSHEYSGWNPQSTERQVDPNLRLASFGEGGVIGMHAPFSNNDSVSDLIKRYQLNQYPDPLPGVPLTIEAAISQAAPQYRAAMVQQYWATFGAWARYLQSQEQVTNIKRLNRAGGGEGTLIQGALAIAENQLAEMEEELQNQQRRLQNFLPNPRATSLLALPADLPLVTVYDTHYETFSSMNRLPYEHRTINQQLPKLLARIEGAANASRLNQQAVQQLAGGNLTSALLAIQQSAIADRQFIAAVVNYNQMIGDYSLKVAPWDTAPDRLAGMLVLPAENASAVGAGGAPIRQAQLNSESTLQ